MKIKKILVSQPKPASEKSPYFSIESKYGVQIVFRPLFKVEGLTSKEFRQSKISIPDYTAIIFTARVAVDNFFRLCKEMRINIPDTLKYFCVSETVANYLQKYIVYRKRKIFFSETGRLEGLVPLLEKHKKEKYLYPISEAHSANTALINGKNINYTPAVMYRTVSNDFPAEELPTYDMFVFFTPTGIKAFLESFPQFKQGDIAIGCMGQATINTAKEAGLRVDLTTTPEMPSMAAAIDDFLSKHQDK